MITIVREKPKTNSQNQHNDTTPPPLVEKELGVSPLWSRGGSDDGDLGETVEIGQNTKFCPNLELTMNGPKSEQSEIKQNSTYHQVRRFELHSNFFLTMEALEFVLGQRQEVFLSLINHSSLSGTHSIQALRRQRVNAFENSKSFSATMVTSFDRRAAAAAQDLDPRPITGDSSRESKSERSSTYSLANSSTMAMALRLMLCSDGFNITRYESTHVEAALLETLALCWGILNFSECMICTALNGPKIYRFELRSETASFVLGQRQCHWSMGSESAWIHVLIPTSSVPYLLQKSTPCNLPVVTTFSYTAKVPTYYYYLEQSHRLARFQPNIPVDMPASHQPDVHVNAILPYLLEVGCAQ
ncbi:hypothetical protein B0H14DRAFT_2642220 [Mycena olivaceomarginata]|nr:hypothetical protein B0H14DRAFT_2642220 [Mycena olivaceomarginata]